MNSSRPVIAIFIAAALAAGTGCSRDGGTAPDAVLPSTRAVEARPAAGDSGDTRAGLVAGVEAAFSERNAKARWDGEVMHVAMEGDAAKSMAGWTECRVLHQLVEDGQSGVLEFPNGTLHCTKVLEGPQ
jgi:hypothetical protein